MDQVNTTLNPLCPCTVNPSHSAHSHIHSAFDFSAHPLAPLGCRAISHERAVSHGGTQGAWGNRGRAACCIGLVMKAHRVWNFCNPVTEKPHNNDAAKFCPDTKIPVAPTSEHPAEPLDRVKEIPESPPAPHMHPDEDEKSGATLR